MAEDDDDHLAKFKDDAEKLFENAETKINGYMFDFEAAKILVTNLQQHVKHYMAQGCPEADLEAAVLERASVTASWLAAGAEKVHFFTRTRFGFNGVSLHISLSF